MRLDHSPIRPPRNMCEEQIFARRWNELMSLAPSDEYDAWPLEAVLRGYSDEVDQRVASVAASFICWLGTGVGLGFLSLGRTIRENTHCKHDAYVAAWGVSNLRRASNNSGARTIEFLLRSEADQSAYRFPQVSVNDLEVLEQVAAWLGTVEGLAFVEGCEAEIKRQKAMDTIGQYHALGLGHLPCVKELESEFIATEPATADAE